MNEFKNCLKNRDAWITVFIYDRVAVLILRCLVLFKFNKSASRISYFGFICCLIATILILKEQYIFSIIFLQLITIVDCVDGKWARYTNTSSDYGVLLDCAIDLYAHFVLGLFILSKLYFFDTLLFFAYGINVFLLGALHTWGLMNPSAPKYSPVKADSKWDSWTAKNRLTAVPVSEVELAFLVPSLVLTYMAGIDVIWLIMLVYVAFTVSKVYTLILRYRKI